MKRLPEYLDGGKWTYLYKVYDRKCQQCNTEHQEVWEEDSTGDKVLICYECRNLTWYEFLFTKYSS